MKTEKISIKKIKLNPNNPRVIRDDKFKKLVKSIQEFPEMLDIRPIVVNADSIVLGGNMRLKACQEAGLKEIPVLFAEHLTEEQQRQFIIKDNIGYGEWDWDMIINEWNTDELEKWGLDVIKHDWDNLDYIDEEVKPVLPLKNTIIIIVPDSSNIIEVENDIKKYLEQNHIGCEIK